MQTSDRWLVGSWVYFVFFWVVTQFAGTRDDCILHSGLLTAAILVWTFTPILARPGGLRTLLADIVKQLGALLTRERRELAFLLTLPIVLLVGRLYEKQEPALIAVSFLYAICNIPANVLGLVRSATDAASGGSASDEVGFLSQLRTTAKRLLLTVALVVVGAAIMCVALDVTLQFWSIALFYNHPLKFACMKRDHFITKRLRDVSGDELLSTMRFGLSFMTRYFDRMGEVPGDYRSLLFVYILAQLTVASPRLRQRLQAPFIVVVYTGILSAAMKILVHRERPMWDANPTNFTGPSFTWRNAGQFSKVDMSTPSGHVAVTVAVGRALYRLWLRDNYQVDSVLPAPSARRRSLAADWLRAAPFFIFGLMVAICRTARCAHWPSDCLMGALIGVVVAGRVVPSPEARPTALGLLSGILKRD